MRVVLTGASGQLGAYLRGTLTNAGHVVVAWSGHVPNGPENEGLRPVDLTDAEATARALADANPEVILHVAALSNPESVRRDPERGRAVNVEATARLAAWCARRNRRLIFTSSDLVFDGANRWCREDDPVNPLMEYGRNKRDAEHAVRACAGGLVARLSLLYGTSRCGREGYFDRTIAALRRSEPQTFFEDEYRTPLDFATTALVLSRLVRSDVVGTLHVAGPERLSRVDLIRRVAVGLGLDPSLVRANRQSDVPLTEPRPADVSLDTTRLAALFPDLRRLPVEEAVRLNSMNA
jgi:dTDP-4-dehydrorhamnose reductase